LRKQVSEIEIMITRIPIVASAGGGLGRATARALHTVGLTVVTVNRNVDRNVAWSPSARF
jgi:NADP-dependent 3-hydroxy acid dehydrogenase YdfG